MNRDRRRALANGHKMIVITLDNCIRMISHFEETKDDEEMAYEGYPENLRDTDRARESEEAIGVMEEIINHLQDAQDALEEAKGELETIVS